MQSILSTLRTFVRWYGLRFRSAGRNGKIALGVLPVILIVACCGALPRNSQQTGNAQPTAQAANVAAIAPTEVLVPTEVPEPTAVADEAPAPTDVPEPTAIAVEAPEPTEAPAEQPTQALPAPTTAPSVPSGTVSTPSNIRRQPSTDAEITAKAALNEVVTLTGRLEDTSWYAVKTASGVEGWMATTLLTVDPAVASALPVQAAPVVIVPTKVPAAPAAAAPAKPSGARAPQGSDCPAGFPFKGNQSGIYHRPGGGSYKSTKPEQCFATSAEAEAAGYRAAKN